MEGFAYLLDLRCFFAGRGDEDEVVVDVVSLVATVVVVRERFADCVRDADDGVPFSLIERLAY